MEQCNSPHSGRLVSQNTGIPICFSQSLLVLGGLRFASAKAVDVAFDLLIGRGLQTLLGILVYPLLRRTILRELEVKPLPLPLLVSMYTERMSLSSLRALARPHWNRTFDIRHLCCTIRWRLVCIFLIMGYVLTVPTFLSAMTSYQAESTPFIQLPYSNDSIPATDLTNPPSLLENPGRIGLNEYGRDYFPIFQDATNSVDKAVLSCEFGRR